MRPCRVPKLARPLLTRLHALQVGASLGCTPCRLARPSVLLVWARHRANWSRRGRLILCHRLWLMSPAENCKAKRINQQSLTLSKAKEETARRRAAERWADTRAHARDGRMGGSVWRVSR